MTSISVIVATYTAERFLDVKSCIDSLNKQTCRAQELILVLDPCKTLIDFYKSRLSPNIKIVVSSRKGLSSARNAGVRVAEGDVVAFIDDDATADERWIENLVKDYRDPSIIGVGGLVRPAWQHGRPWWIPEELDWVVGCSYKGLPISKGPIRNPIGCNMSFRKEVFDIAGYFATDLGRIGNALMGHEDTEFATRIAARIPNSIIVYDPEAIVDHRVPEARTTIKYFLARSYAEGFSKAFFSLHESRRVDVLYVEKRFLKDALLGGILGRLFRAGHLKSVVQILTLAISVSAVTIGYLFGRLCSRKRITWTELS